MAGNTSLFLGQLTLGHVFGPCEPSGPNWPFHRPITSWMIFERSKTSVIKPSELVPATASIGIQALYSGTGSKLGKRYPWADEISHGDANY